MAKLTCGLEIHQQLEGKKLFCSCPTKIRSDKPDFIVRRKLHVAAGETGEIDIAAAHEKKKDKWFAYQGYRDAACLVELDEEPPHPVDEEALSIALTICHMLQCKVVDRIQFMRKTVLDGSNTSGFQRTCLIGRGGYIEADGKRIGIQTVCLEEDACMISSRTDTEDVYNLSRLGIPLIEIATEPDITDQKEAMHVAAKLGMILRSLDGIKRGLGTIRQDLNVSIPGGARVEIKGAQDLKMIPTIIENEIKRQEHLLALGERLRSRTTLPPDGKLIDVTIFFDRKKAPDFLKRALEKSKVFGMRLPGLAGLIGHEEIRNQRIGYEFAAFAKQLGFGGVMHADEDMKKYGADTDKIRSALECGEHDGFVLCVGDQERITALFELIAKRVERLVTPGEEVAPEVRKAEDDGTTTYLRPMPGAARMYPETDIPLITPDLSAIRTVELIEHKAERLEEKGLSKDLALALAKAGLTEDVMEFIGRFKNIKPAFLAETMIATPAAIRRKENIAMNPTLEDFAHIFSELDLGSITKDAVYDILCDLGRTGKLDFSRFELLSEADVKKEIENIIKENKGKPENVLIGIAMGRLKGRADPAKVIAAVKEALG